MTIDQIDVTATSRIDDDGITRHEGQAQVVAHKLFATTFEADFYDIKPGKRIGHFYVLQPVEYVEAVAAAGATATV